jgi:hypothetical protein
MMNVEIWNILHDGTIVQISGSIPGEVEMAIEIEYLRQRFSDPGQSILLLLHNCTAVGYQAGDDDAVVTDFAAIAAAQLEILSADEPTTVCCGGGFLHVDATDCSIALDSRRRIIFSFMYPRDRPQLYVNHVWFHFDLAIIAQYLKLNKYAFDKFPCTGRYI